MGTKSATEVLSLDQLKKENAAEAGETPPEEPETPETPEEPPEEPPVEEPEAPEAEPEADPDEDPDADPGAEKPDDEVPAWAKAEDDAEDPGTLPDSQAAQIRRKWKGRVKEKDSEIEQLKQELEDLKKQGAHQQQGAPAQKDKPKRDDFDDEDAFIEALTDYKLQLFQAQSQSKQTADQKKRQQEQEKQKIDKAVDGHYTRAMQLAEKSNISADAYKSADLRFRQAIEDVFPDAGDTVADYLISMVGEGSEKVVYNLGVNPARLAKLKETFQEDRNGLAAAAYLGRLNAELSAPAKRTSKAPPPGEDIKGDARATDNSSRLKKRWQEAHKKGNIQEAFEAKKAAKDKGVDTSGWR